MSSPHRGSTQEPSSTLQWPGGELSYEDVQTFVGKNSDWYWFKWKEMAQKSRQFSLNWSAAFLGVAWLGYRKMNLEAAKVFAGYLLVMFICGFAFSGERLNFAQALIVGLFLTHTLVFLHLLFTANDKYRNFTLSMVRKSQSLYGDDPQQRASYLRLKGGVNWTIAIVWFFVFSVTVLAIVGVTSKRHSAPKLVLDAKSYFVKPRFKNPDGFEALYFRRLSPLAEMPKKTQLVMNTYVTGAGDQMKKRCRTSFSKAAETKAKLFYSGILGSGLNSIVSSNPSQPFSQWLGATFTLGFVEKFARQDMDRFLQDHKSCAHKAVQHLKGSIDQFVRKMPLK